LYERSLNEIEAKGLRLLPQSLNESLAEFKKDDVVRAGLGVIANEFLDLKTKEWKTYNGQVTAWETQQYLTGF
jgi:glutamine synthetase